MDFNKIKSPDDVKKLNLKELNRLATFLRQKITDVERSVQMHYSSNLCIVDLIIALIKTFDVEKDSLLLEGGYACYAYKMLTGRMKQFTTLRTTNGIEGFLNSNESKYDKFGSAHLGDTISLSAGLSLENDNYVICVIGDGAISNGESFEAINNIATLKRKKLIIILNDNGMFISPPVGGIDYSLKNIKTKNIFKDLGYEYIGPIDGNNIEVLLKQLKQVKTKAINKTILLHIKTKKGLGNKLAEEDKVGTKHVSGGVNSLTSYSKIAMDYLMLKTKQDKSIHVINPAMAVGLDCNDYQSKFPNNYHDVGISEQYAISYASGLYLNNKKPIVAFYSTFLQRSYDQLLQNIARNNYPLLVLSCRADLSPGDGNTHHGIYDLGMLKTIPNTNIVNPRCIEQIKYCIDQGLINKNKEIYVIRLPKNSFTKTSIKSKLIKNGIWEKMISNKNAKTCIVSYGPVCDLIYQNIKSNKNVDLINAWFTTKYDECNLKDIFSKYKHIIIYERIYGNNGLANDFYKYALDHDIKSVKIQNMNYVEFPGMGDINMIDKKNKMSIEDIFLSFKP